MFNKFALAAALALPLAVLDVSGSAMAGYSPTSRTPIARAPLQTPGAYHAAMSCAASKSQRASLISLAWRRASGLRGSGRSGAVGIVAPPTSTGTTGMSRVRAAAIS